MLSLPMSIRNKGKVIFHFVESGTEKRFSLIMLPDRKSLREKPFSSLSVGSEQTKTAGKKALGTVSERDPGGGRSFT